MENIDITPEEEVNTTTTEETPAEGTEDTQNQEEETIGDINKEEEPQNDNKVGLDKFLDLKKQNKELKKALKDLESRIEEGASSDDISDDIANIAREYDVDDKLLKKLAKSIRAEVENDLEARISPKLAKLEEREKAEKFSEAFNKYYTQAMDRMPELADVSNKDVIRQLAQNPANAKKTVSQLIEETYGNAVAGRRTIEKTTPNGGKDPVKVDFERARKDTAYFNEVMANPELKKQYNTDLHKRIPL